MSKKYKHLLAGFILGVLIFSSMPVFGISTAKNIQAVFSDIKIEINDKVVDTPDKPFLYNDHTYLPIRLIVESLAATVQWDSKNNTVKIISKDPANAATSELSLGPWCGKVWAVEGDSITEGATIPANERYLEVVKSILGIASYTNYGIGGKRISYQPGYSPTAVCRNMSNLNINADLITVFAGTNDWEGNIPLGQQSSTNDGEFYGALRKTCEDLITRFPTKRIAFFTPMQRTQIGADYWNGTVDSTNSLGLKLIDYVDAVKYICGLYSIPVLDLYRTAGITKQNITNYTYDGLHPNSPGHARLGAIMAAWLKTIY